jgi:hypothetical protein
LNPIDDAEEDAEQPGPRRTVVDPLADLVEPVNVRLNPVGRRGQGSPQRLF